MGTSTTNRLVVPRVAKTRAEGDIHHQLVQITLSLVPDRHRDRRGRAWFRRARRDDDVVGRDGDIARRPRGIGIEQQRQRRQSLALQSIS